MNKQRVKVSGMYDIANSSYSTKGITDIMLKPIIWS